LIQFLTDTKAHQVNQANLVKMGHQEFLVLLDPKVNQELPELQDMKVSPAQRVLEEMMAYLEHQAKMENRDYLDHLVLKERFLIIMPRLQILINPITGRQSNIKLMYIISYIYHAA